MNYRYYLPDDGETIEDARDIYRDEYRYVNGAYRFVRATDCDDHEDAATTAAAMYHARSAGDWSHGTCRFAVVDEHETVKVFDVELEFEPSFNVSEVAGS